MSLIKWSPMSIDPFEDFFDWPRVPAHFTPAIDVWQDADNVYVETPLAGVDPKDVNVAVEMMF